MWFNLSRYNTIHRLSFSTTVSSSSGLLTTSLNWQRQLPTMPGLLQSCGTYWQHSTSSLFVYNWVKEEFIVCVVDILIPPFSGGPNDKNSFQNKNCYFKGLLPSKIKSYRCGLGVQMPLLNQTVTLRRSLRLIEKSLNRSLRFKENFLYVAINSGLIINISGFISHIIE